MDHNRTGEHLTIPSLDHLLSPRSYQYPTTRTSSSSTIWPPIRSGAPGHTVSPPPSALSHANSPSQSFYSPHSYPYSPSHIHSRSHGPSSAMIGYSNPAVHRHTPDRHYAGHPGAVNPPHVSSYYSPGMPQPAMHHTASLSEYEPRRPSIPPITPYHHSRASIPPPHSAHHHSSYATHPLPPSPHQYPRYDSRGPPYELGIPGSSLSRPISAPGPIVGHSRIPSPQVPPGPPLPPEQPQLPQSPFRFSTTLETQTSMVQRDDEIPITYLNKSQKYRIIICDMQPPTTVPIEKLQYRTSIRVTFDDAGQRREPVAAWELWKESRDTRTDDDSRSSGSLLRALEFIDEGERRRPFGTDVQLENHQFDSFTVIWTPTITTPPQCAINVRFNFLSTDFSQTKGVKGVAVRVVAKTSILNTDLTGPNATLGFSELSYCKAKVFRDHGAERKLAIDSDRVRRNIEKIRHSLRGSERGIMPRRKDRITKRLRNITRGRSVRCTVIDRALEEEKYDPGDDDLMGQDDDDYASSTESLQIQLRNLEQMTRSINSFTVFVLSGEEEDDPDLHPVRFYNDKPRGGSLDCGRSSFGVIQTSPWADRAGSASETKPGPSNLGTPTKSVDAVDIDRSYRPPPPGPRAVACFYFRNQTPSHRFPLVRLSNASLFRATYLMQRSVDELRKRIGAKWSAKTLSARVVYINPQGLEVAVDEDFVQQMPEGQAYDIELKKAVKPSTPKMLPSVSSSAGKAALPALLNDPTPEEEAAAAAAADEVYEIRMALVSH